MCEFVSGWIHSVEKRVVVGDLQHHETVIFPATEPYYHPRDRQVYPAPRVAGRWIEWEWTDGDIAQVRYRNAVGTVANRFFCREINNHILLIRTMGDLGEDGAEYAAEILSKYKTRRGFLKSLDGKHQDRFFEYTYKNGQLIQAIHKVGLASYVFAPDRIDIRTPGMTCYEGRFCKLQTRIAVLMKVRWGTWIGEDGSLLYQPLTTARFLSREFRRAMPKKIEVEVDIN